MDSFDPIPPSQPETRPSLEPAKPVGPENPVFNLVDVLIIAAVAFVSLIFTTIIAVFILLASRKFRLDPKDLASNVLVFIPVQVLAYILTVGFMVFWVWQRYRTGFLQAVRWNMPGARFAWGAVAGGSVLGLISDVLSGLLHRWIPKHLPMDEFFRTPGSAYALAAFGILIAPVVEELFFRGFLYPALARPLGVVPATALTAAGFALLHSSQLAHAWVPLLMLFGVGTVLTAVRALTKSVAVCVLIHTGYNFTLFAVTYILTHGFRHLEQG